jgi:hypothetical protein
MAFPKKKKGLRKITVDGIIYGYRTQGTDWGILFSIALFDKEGGSLIGGLPYNGYTVTDFSKKDGSAKSWNVFHRTKITPFIIRQAIEKGLRNGWDTFDKESKIDLGNLDGIIDSNLEPAKGFPKLNLDQVAIYSRNVENRQVLNLNMERYRDGDDLYCTFDSLQEAKNFAQLEVTKNSEIECWIVSEKDKALYYINSTEEKAYNKT